MALARLKTDEAYRFFIATPNHFADASAPTAAELNKNLGVNDPNGTIFHITCALDTANTTFDLDDAEKDESLSFCQTAGDSSPMSRSATIVFGIFMAKERWTNGSSTSPANGFNTSTLAQSLITWKGVDYIVGMSIGKASDANYAVGDIVKMAGVATDNAPVTMGSGENLVMVQTFAKRSFLNWNYPVAS